jgi:hypothetical protein
LRFLIQTSYSAWFIPICLILGAGFTFLFYQKSNFQKNNRFFSFPNVLLSGFRFVVLTLLCYFLLSPFIKRTFERKEKPIIIIAADNSKSIKLNKDSAYYSGPYQNDIKRLEKELSRKFEVHTYTFGKVIKNSNIIEFKENRTNISDLMNFLYEQYFNRSLGAIILASDGIYNEGENPLPLASNFKVPIYTIALGDTNLKKDIYIKNVEYNSVSYAGNLFPIIIHINAGKCIGSKVILSVSNNNKIIHSEYLTIGSNYFDKTIELRTKADQPGLQKYSINISRIAGEISYTNNNKEIFIDIMENRKKILILANAPHPDVFAIKNAILKNDNYQTTTLIASDFVKGQTEIEKELSKYDLLILHQLPSKTNNAKDILAAAETKNTPLFLILGIQSNIPQFNAMDIGLKIFQKREGFNNVLPVSSPDFNYFNLLDNFSELLNEFPPLVAPFGDYKLNLENQVLITQKIGQVNTGLPLLVFINDMNKRNAVLCGEGLWKWPLQEFKFTGEQKAFDEMISKTVQFLGVKADKRFFRLKDYRPVFYEDEQVNFDAEVLNQNFEKMKNAKVIMKLTGPDKKTSQYLFQETDEGYRLNTGYLTVGKYNYMSTTNVNGKEQKIYGEFNVNQVDIEYINTIADHNLLFAISKEREGKMYYPNQIDEIINSIKKNTSIKPMSYFDTQGRELIDLKWFFFLFIIFLSAEWFLRKFYGFY